MAIDRIDPDLCTGCGICVNSCFMDVIRMDEGTEKAAIRYGEDCVYCGFCARDCPKGAISLAFGIRLQPVVAW
ncbi:MAG: 4Fe-4S binding protein [Deltaproteobacteria bacterium]|nr:4Fe-4S binding protein [Deltaproteobacteria bacterium]